MNNEPSEDLRSALQRFLSERKLSVNGWAQKAGIPESSLRNFLAGRSETLTYTTLASLARAAEVNISRLLGSAGEKGKNIFIWFEANADRWVKRSMADSEVQFAVMLPLDPRYPDAIRQGVLMSDNSMDIHYREGSILISSPYVFLDRQPQVGDRVLCAERKSETNEITFDPKLEKITVREIAEYDGEWWLVFRSNSPKWHHPVKIPAGVTWSFDDEDGMSLPIEVPVGEGHVELLGLVIGSYRLE